MATYYVKLTGGSDANNGTRWSLAKATVQAALDIMASGDTLRISPGTYASQLTFGSTQNGKNLSLIAYNGLDSFGDSSGIGDGSTLFSRAGNMVYLNTNMLSGNVTLDGINITSSAGNPFCIFLEDVNYTGTLTVKNCTIIGYPYFVGTSGPNRNGVFQNVTFSPVAGSGYFLCNSIRDLTFDHCTINLSGSIVNPPGSIGGLAGSTLKSAIYTYCTFNADYYSNTYAVITSATLAAGVIRLDNCTVNSRVALMRFPGVAGSTLTLIAYNNTFNLTSGVPASDQDVYAILWGDSDLTATTTIGAPIIRDNVVVINHNGTTRTGHSAGFYVGKGVSGGLVCNNKVSGNGVSQGIFLLGSYITCIHNSCSVPGGDAIIIEGGIGCVVAFNSIYSLDAPSTGSTLMLRDGAGGANNPLNNIIMNNIVHGAGTSVYAYGFSSHTLPAFPSTVSSNILDWNLYFLEGASAIALGTIDGPVYGHDSAGVGALLDWSTYTNGTQWNDQHSIVANPQYKDPANGNLLLKASSPGIGIKSPANPNLATWNDLGAWQSDPGGGLRRMGLGQ